MVGLLTLWGIRTAAIFSVLLPLALLGYSRRVKWRNLILPTLAFVIVVYGVVTLARQSNLNQIVEGWLGAGQPSLRGNVSSMYVSQERLSILDKTLADASYRTAGLEAVAAIVGAQQEKRLSPRWGLTIVAGMRQALPAMLRTRFEDPAIIKLAPSESGIFQPGDWVTTLLAEFTFDFGPVGLFLPAVASGLFLSMISNGLLQLGQIKILEGLLIARIAFFVYLVTIGDSLARSSVLFLKACIGYILVLVLLGVLVDLLYPGRQARAQDFSHSLT